MDVQQVVHIRWQADSPAEDDVRAAFQRAGAMNPGIQPSDKGGVDVTFEYNEEPGFAALDVARRAAEGLGPVEVVESVDRS